MNTTVKDFGTYDAEERKRLFRLGTESGDKDRILVWAGTGVHLINDLKPSKVRYFRSLLRFRVLFAHAYKETDITSCFISCLFRQEILETIHDAAVKRLAAVKDCMISV
jgi:hypothetical protein